jgi:SOS response regulatory protein OraA/RecX
VATDGLAPVTYLFGATAPQEPAASPSVPTTDPDGWYDPTGDRAEPRSGRAEPRPETPRSDLRNLPNFIENPDVPAVTIPAPAGESKAERRASNVSLNALARRGMSSREMENLLERRELEPENIESEIARLEGSGLLDDSALAENLVRTLQERKGLGKSAISAELRRRKIDDAAISEALETIDADDELERAIEIATKRAGQLSSYDAETAKRRLGAFMQRRGYGGSVLSQAMAAALEGRRGSGPRFS